MNPQNYCVVGVGAFRQLLNTTSSSIAARCMYKLMAMCGCGMQSDAFQDDLFPPCFSGQPSHTSEEWLAGSEMAPMKMDMRPSSRETTSKKKKGFPSLKNAKELQREVR